LLISLEVDTKPAFAERFRHGRRLVPSAAFLESNSAPVSAFCRCLTDRRLYGTGGKAKTMS
jgi:hypothetical protein